MRLYRLPIIAIALLFAAPMAITSPMQPATVERDSGSARTNRKRRLALASAPARYRRSRNAPTKRKLKSNRLHISKRVRRKHRRAA